jgi:hypothetical protein
MVQNDAVLERFADNDLTLPTDKFKCSTYELCI